MPESALQVIEHHGYLGLYLSLALGILGLPIPDETLMTFTGYLVYRGNMSYVASVAVALLGSLTGMSLSYWIGRGVGVPFIHRFGKYIHITPDRFATGQQWFHKYGSKAIIAGYFVPGFRHLTAYLSGISKLSFARFLGIAAIGAGIWVTVFITIGRLIGKNWQKIGHLAHRYLVLLVIIAVLVIIIITVIRKERRNQQ